LAVLLALLVVLFWGTAASAFEIALRRVTPFQLLVHAVGVSTAVLLLVLLLRRGPRALAHLPARLLVRSALLGVLNPFLYYLVLFAAYDRLPGQVAMSLNYAWPMVLALLAVPILGQPLARRQLGALGVSFAGAVVIVTGGRFGFDAGLDGIGIALALGSTLIWATFWLLNARDGADPVVKLLLASATGLVVALAASPVLGGLHWPPAAAWPALAYVGLFEMGLTFVLWLTALQLSDSAARLGQLIYLTPFLSLLFLHLVVGEPIQPTTPLGLVLIVGALLWQGRDRERPAPSRSSR
jgi:drug/metabolite transporter (DMT)-like permease